MSDIISSFTVIPNYEDRFIELCGKEMTLFKDINLLWVCKRLTFEKILRKFPVEILKRLYILLQIN